MRKMLLISLILVVLAVLVGPPLVQAAPCYECDHIFNSWFCFPGYPGRENCVDTPTYCALSGAFCDIIIVDG